MKTYNCKNCGAEVSHTFNHRCEYCGGILDFNVPEDKIAIIKPEELHEIEFVEAYTTPYDPLDIHLIFTGYKNEIGKIHEVENNKYISEIIEYINPIKSSFGIIISREELNKLGADAVRRRLYLLNVSYKEIEKVINELIDKGLIHVSL